MIDFILTDELKGVVSIIFFENSNNSFWEWNSKPIFLRIQKSYKVFGNKFLLIVSSCVNLNFMITVDRNIENFRNELNLLLRRLVQSNWSV